MKYRFLLPTSPPFPAPCTQAVMAARRAVVVEAEEAVVAPQSAAEKMMEKFMPPSIGTRSVGGASSGNGYEIMFQASG